MASKTRVLLLETSRGHCPARPDFQGGVIASAWNGNLAGVGVGLGGIISQLFHGLESTPVRRDAAVTRHSLGRLISDCALAHSVDFFRALGLNRKALDLV